MTRPFADSNILVYAFAAGDPYQATAYALLQDGVTLSVQSLNEFANVLSRKLRWDSPSVRDALISLRSVSNAIVPVDLALHDFGIMIFERYRLSIYDSMIVAAALQAGCDTLYSEDMQDGQVIEGRLTVINPFRDLTS
ncbi:PIN domain-containing protein [Sphingomonas floccifaciens]|uniref:PIN domain-containing protein n=1 Tax=Sphingomonas floccifaciens TaxID=1844115 RepID=A0ABW4N9N9_9SPHN